MVLAWTPSCLTMYAQCSAQFGSKPPFHIIFHAHFYLTEYDADLKMSRPYNLTCSALRRMLADLVIGWVQEEVLLSMYARFAMQPAVIPDVTVAEEGEEQDSGVSQRQRRRLAGSRQAGVTVNAAQEEPSQRSDSSGTRWRLAALRSDEEPQQRRPHFQTTANEQTLAADPARSRGRGSGGGEGRGGSGMPAVRWPLARTLRLGWRYRRRKDVFEEEQREGRQLSQSLDAASRHAADSDGPPNPAWQQLSSGQNRHHRERQRQQQQQQQPHGLQIATGDSHGGGHEAEQLPDSLYPGMPPPMFAQNAGADARRCRSGYVMLKP